MATKKAQSSAKKPKKAPAKATSTKAKPAAKKKTTAAKKATPKKAAATKKAPAKKVEKKTPVKKTESKKKVPAKKKNNTLTTVIIAAVVLLVLLGLAVLISYDQDKEKTYKDEGPIELSGDEVHLIVIEDPDCSNCQVDLYVKQIQDNLIDNLKVEKTNFNSPNGLSVLSEINSPYVPLYLFSQEITQRDDWDLNLKNAFSGVIDINDKSYYLLNPQVVQSKKLIVQLPVLDETITLGSDDAQLTIYEFSDYECPFCALAEGNEEYLEQYRVQQPGYEPAVPSIIEEYVNTGKVRYVFYNYHPLHPTARDAHLAALCANEQDNWLEFNKKLYLNQQEWASKIERTDLLRTYAQEVGLNVDEFDTCVSSGKHDQQIENEILLGQQLQITGTPTFVIGDVVVQGAEDFVNLRAIIDSKLS